MDDRTQRLGSVWFHVVIGARGLILISVIGLALSCAGEDSWDEFTGEWQKLHDRCIELFDHGKILEGKEFAEQFLNKAQRELGETNDVTAQAFHWIATFNQYGGHFKEAEKIWYRALEIDEALHGKNSLATTRRLHLL